ncbi:glutaredoxin [Pigmentibacter sp. JX0631]|uniref:glutaredoxin n=1 Tax=Pigmentibacter sp. JX0631 TaxID=2976982 RepID=UPI002468FAAE|nr:glutaredoxin [Pigmentibacter sp. JX0631]WGL59957.1 glutaredoxin [Pigmentibacter sp. JX0631]
MTKVLIYTTTVCPYCNAAKNLFKSLNVEYEEINLDSDSDLRAKLSAENNGWRTVPMIFIDGKFIGGFDDANKLHKEGKLLNLLGKN